MKGNTALLKRFASVTLHRSRSFINKHPRLQRTILAIIRKLGLYSLARVVYTRMAVTSGQSETIGPYGFIPTEFAHLPPRARQVYSDLKAAMERRQKENG